MTDSMKCAIEMRQNGQNLFFTEKDSMKMRHGTVVGKTHDGNFVVNDGEKTIIVDSYTFEAR